MSGRLHSHVGVSRQPQAVRQESHRPKRQVIGLTRAATDATLRRSCLALQSGAAELFRYTAEPEAALVAREIIGDMKRTGFTLLELLVVLGILSLLTAILFPVFARAREKGRRTVCQSNLKQIALAVQQYVQDNSQMYPLENTWQNDVYTYIKNRQVYRCPSDQDEDMSTEQIITGSPGSLEVSPVDYKYNWTRLNIVQSISLPLPPNNYRGINDSAIASPATVWLNMDLGYETEDDVLQYGPEIDSSCGRSFYGSSQHSGGGNYSYLDGHVKWLTPEEAAEIECENGPLPAPFPKNM